MLPLTLDIARWPVLLAGQGPALARRLALVRDSGGTDRRIHDLGNGGTLPAETEIAVARILFVVGLPHETARDLATIARRNHVLVNVEDVPELCDFHVPALVRRGDLSIAISTAGKGPGLASALRRHLDGQFGAEWAGHVTAASALRTRMRADGQKPAAIAIAMRYCASTWLQPRSPGS